MKKPSTKRDGAIRIQGARQHNLKSLDLELPRHKLSVVCGLSGSGKSSLALDTLYAEGQRRYVESLSAYVRQFLEQVPKPEVDAIYGLPPAVAVQRKPPGHNPRSSVGTLTEIHDYLRVLYARVGQPHCPQCGRPLAAQTVQEMVQAVLKLSEGTRFSVLAPLSFQLQGPQLQRALKEALRQGYVRCRVDGEELELVEAVELDFRRKRRVDLTVDRLVVRPQVRARLADSLQLALKLADGVVAVAPVEGEELLFSEKYACAYCGRAYKPLEPRDFSPNSPAGMCLRCNGLGYIEALDPEKVIPDKSRSIAGGALAPLGNLKRHPDWLRHLDAQCRKLGFTAETPLNEVPEAALQAFLYGESGEGGIMGELERARAHGSRGFRQFLHRFVGHKTCPECKGGKLKPEALAVTLGGKNIAELQRLTLADALDFMENLTLTETQRHIAGEALREVVSRLRFLLEVGVGYLTLDRPAGTLSGGEAQRINLASQLGSQLTGVLYVLDEPSIGLHSRDLGRLLKALKDLRDLGNTVVVIEHDRQVLEAADMLFELGPAPGEAGGFLVAQGTAAELKARPESLTGRYLAGREKIASQRKRRPLPEGAWLKLKGVRHRNLKGIDVAFPPGCLTCVTGVSGAGKSSLVQEVLYPALANALSERPRFTPGAFEALEGAELFNQVLLVDQSSLGNSPRTNAAVYVGAFGHIRELFARLPLSKARGYKPGRFSFNVPGGRCEACQGLGARLVEMHFLADVWVPCEVCGGKRYNQETLRVRFKGKNIADVLELTVDEAVELFEGFERLQRSLRVLQEVGLGYLKLGQPGNTLSGGEAQRVKIAHELAKPAPGPALYLLDEPTTGLHFADIARLLSALDKLLEAGNTVVVIEHNLEFIQAADYVLDLGPEGGDAGGFLVAQGTPEEIAQVPSSYTGRALAGLKE